ncbi:MAG TPA: hypothetical protein VFO52_00855 [Longimicrobiales bacterium]|nr:hypothetical protein [Longimicrobiales bacterium]
MLFACVRVGHAQHLTSYGIGAGVTTQSAAQPTAAFALSAGVRWQLPWLALFQRSVADLKGDAGGTLRATSLALMPALELWHSRILLAAGPSLHARREERFGASDASRTRAAPTGAAALRLPIAGEGVAIELLARADLLDSDDIFTGIFGVRIKPGLPRTLTRGEPIPARLSVERAAVWNDVIMQLVLLQQSLESFTRIRELENGIDLEFDQRSVTLYDDVARVARVLAAADPPVALTVYAPNAGRVGAAVTAGSFPAERLRLQRESRVYLRVEH